jgi:hypothetical protein
VAQHNEHRIPVLRVLFLGLGYLTGWNIKRLFLTLGVACSVLWMLHRAGLERSPGQGISLVCLALTSPMLFGLVQWESGSWASGSTSTFPSPS